MKKLAILIPGLLIMLFSCETVVKIDVPEQAGKLVVNSVFQAVSEISVSVSRSIGPLDQGYDWDYVTNAVVELYEDDIYIGAKTNSSTGIYSFGPPSFLTKAGSKYEVKVLVEGEETIQAVTHIPEPLTITNAIWTDTISYFDEQYHELTLFFSDPPDVDNFYNLQFYISDPAGSYQVCYAVIENYFVNVGDEFDDFFNNELTEYCGEGFFNDRDFNGEVYSMKILINENDLFSLFSFPTLSIIMGLLSEDYYEYRLTSDLQSTTQDNPFAQPVSVYSNVEGGFGAFCGLNFTVFELHF